MKISTKTRYGMRAMLDLASRYEEGCTPLKDVAERQGLSKKYLEQVVAPLAAAGLLTVTRGYAGGYQLARPPRDITLADVVSASEDGLELMTAARAAASGAACKMPSTSTWPARPWPTWWPKREEAARRRLPRTIERAAASPKLRCTGCG